MTSSPRAPWRPLSDLSLRSLGSGGFIPIGSRRRTPKAEVAEKAAEEAKKDAKAAQDRVSLLDQAFGLYRERVALEYTSTKTLQASRRGIERLGDRFDRAIEHRIWHKGWPEWARTTLSHCVMPWPYRPARGSQGRVQMEIQLIEIRHVSESLFVNNCYRAMSDFDESVRSKFLKDSVDVD